jgi:hypothetical protein
MTFQETVWFVWGSYPTGKAMTGWALVARVYSLGETLRLMLRQSRAKACVDIDRAAATAARVRINRRRIDASSMVGCDFPAEAGA